MNLPNIEWLYIEDIAESLEELRAAYQNDPFVIINKAPIEYVLNLDKVSSFYNDDVLLLAATVIRTIIAGHPLQDGNKRFGMLLGEHFLKVNSLELIDNNQDVSVIALTIACGKMELEDIRDWVSNNVKTRDNSLGL